MKNRWFHDKNICLSTQKSMVCMKKRWVFLRTETIHFEAGSLRRTTTDHARNWRETNHFAKQWFVYQHLILTFQLRGGQLRAHPKSNALLWPPRGGQPRNLYNIIMLWPRNINKHHLTTTRPPKSIKKHKKTIKKHQNTSTNIKTHQYDRFWSNLVFFDVLWCRHLVFGGLFWCFLMFLDVFWSFLQNSKSVLQPSSMI